MPIKILIGGDFCILPPHTEKELIPEETSSFFRNSDLNIVNLECPIVTNDNKDRILKTGPHLSTSEKVLYHLKQLNVHAVTLANNHILDYGEKGVSSTIDACRNEKIITTGAGKNLKEASGTALIEVKGKKIALINFCENEWSTATESSGGANPHDLINNLNQIKEARKKADFVLVIAHGGHEIYNLPSPRMVKEYRFFAENGADAVIGHHTHCINGYEIHGGTPIFYSLGNLLFTKNPPLKGWNTGLIAELKLEEGKPVQFELHPTVQAKDNFQLVMQKGDEKIKTLAEVEHYSRIISNEKVLNDKWNEYVGSKNRTLNIFSPLYNLPWRFPNIFYRLGFNRFFFKKKNMSQILNHIKCEAHRDVITTLLYNKLHQNK